MIDVRKEAKAIIDMIKSRKSNEVPLYFRPHIEAIESLIRRAVEEEKVKSKKLVEALEKIAGEDYRGNRPNSAVIAYKALESYQGNERKE